MKRAAQDLLTNPERVLWPDVGITKQALLDYYEAVWPWLEPHIAGRPLALLRCPQGIGEECFFQKHATQSLPSGIRSVTIDEANHAAPVIDDFSGLAGLVQLSALELHPWSAPIHDIEHPDQLIFDLDPAPEMPWESVVEAALLVREAIEKHGLSAFAKTSGGKGLHVIAPLKPSAGWEEIRRFAQGFSKQLAAENPRIFTAQSAMDERKGLIFLDYLRNGRGTTSIATYCPRARKGALVATPVAWNEVEAGVKPNAFNILSVPDRLTNLKDDPWRDFDAARRPLPETRFNGLE